MSPLLLQHASSALPSSTYPIIAAKLPSHLSAASTTRRVHVPNPWAQCLQMFVKNQNPPQYTVVSTTVNNSGKPCHQIIASQGTQWDLAITLWKMFFKNRTGKAWDSEASEIEA